MAAAQTYTPIATQTLGSAQTTITFNSIPSTYTDLVLVASMRATTVTYNNMNFPLFRFNGDGGTNYSTTELYSRNDSGSWVAASSRASNQTDLNLGGVATTNFGANIFSTCIVNIMNYSNTTTYKTTLSRYGVGGDLTNMDGPRANVGLWRSTAAISSFTITPTSSGQFTSGCTFTLYGIASA